MRAVSANVYYFPLGDCTLGGISSQFKSLLVVHPSDVYQLTPEQRKNAVRPVKRVIFGSEYIHLEPVIEQNGNSMGYMAGGNFLYTSDSRWKEITGCPYPLSIHDRQESPELYEALSK